MLLTRGENSRMRKKAQGRLMQARFIEIHQASEKENKVGYFPNRPRKSVFMQGEVAFDRYDGMAAIDHKEDGMIRGQPLHSLDRGRLLIHS